MYIVYLYVLTSSAKTHRIKFLTSFKGKETGWKFRIFAKLAIFQFKQMSKMLNNPKQFLVMLP